MGLPDEVIDLTFSDDETKGSKKNRIKRCKVDDATDTSLAAGTSSDLVIVDDSNENLKIRPASLPLQEPDGDEDCQVVSVAVEVWNSDLPHQRESCGVHTFSRGPVADNANHCVNCFCFICDCKAALCSSWGDGRTRSDHCNAHSGSVQSRELRRAARRNPTSTIKGTGNVAPFAPAAAARTGPAATAIPKDFHMNEVLEDTREAEESEISRESSYRGCYDDTSSSSQDRSGCECSECAYWMTRARCAYNVREVDGFGFDEEEEVDPLSMLGIETLGGTSDVAPVPSPVFKPGVCTYTERDDPSKDSGLLELACLKFPVKIKEGHSLDDVADRLAPYGFYLPQGHDFGVDSQGNRLTLVDFTKDNSPLKLLPLPIPDPPSPPEPEWRIRSVIVRFADGRSKPTQYGIRVEATATAGRLGAAVLEAVLDPQDDVSQYGTMVIQNIHGDDKEDTLSPSHKVDDVYMMNRKRPLQVHVFKKSTKKSTGSAPKVARIRVALPWITYRGDYHDVFIVPIDYSDVRGGPLPSKNVISKLWEAMTPYIREHAGPELLKKFQTLCVTALRRDLAIGKNYSFSKFQEKLGPRVHNMSHKGCLHLDLDLKSFMPSLSGDIYDKDVWQGFDTHPSGVSSACEANEQYMQLLKKHKILSDLAKDKPRATLIELVNSSEEEGPDQVISSAGGAQAFPSRAKLLPKPRALYTACLIPDDSQVSDKNAAILKVRVFVSPSRLERGGRCASFFTDHATFTNHSATGNRDASTVSPNCVLHHTMSVVLWGNPQFEAMEKKLNHWREKTRYLMSGSIATFMEMMQTESRGAAPQPKGLTVTMRDYQLQTLAFMLENERGSGGFRQHVWIPMRAVNGTKFWYSLLFGKVSRTVPAMPWGGFCCEEMGLGKTVEVLALCLANPAPPIQPAQAKDAAGRIISRATLVVCAVSLVGQWMDEARSKTGGSLSIHMYHGQGRLRDIERLATEFDLIVTTYATLSSDFGGKAGLGTSRSPLHKIKWHRLVLDEAHTVKNPAVGHTKAAVALESDRRWLCTGTPINTELNDLFGQFAVLRFAPFNNRNFFKSYVGSTFGADTMRTDPAPILSVLRSILIRHTKKQVLDGEEVLKLPPKTEELVPVVLSEAEQTAYRTCHERNKAHFQTYLSYGSWDVSRHLLQIMSLLLPMRRICSGGRLRAADLATRDPQFSSSVQVPQAIAGAAATGDTIQKDGNLVAPEDDECPICMDAYEAPAMTSCQHWFCKECILGVLLQLHARCPLCRAHQLPENLREGISASEAALKGLTTGKGKGKGKSPTADSLGEDQGVADPQEGGLVAESKLRVLLKKLREVRRRDPSAKVLIFSQFNSTIEWLKIELMRGGFGHRHISGSMPLKQRAKAIAAFQGDPPTTVFLLSMRAGAVGINLTAASYVFLMEPALNAAIEDQAIGRAWRMGQRNEVKVMRFYVQGSVEERIMEVAKHRNNSSGGRIGGSSEVTDYDLRTEDAIMRRSKVRAQVVAGSINADKQNLRVEELQVLFKDPVFLPPQEPEPQSEEEEDNECMDNEWADDGGLFACAPALAATATSSKTRMRRSKAGIAAVAAGETLVAANAHGVLLGTTPVTAFPQSRMSLHLPLPSGEGDGETSLTRDDRSDHATVPKTANVAQLVRKVQQEHEGGSQRDPAGAILERIRMATASGQRLTPGNPATGVKAGNNGIGLSALGDRTGGGGGGGGGGIASGSGGDGPLTASGSNEGVPASEVVVTEHLPKHTPAVRTRPVRRVPKRDYSSMEVQDI